MAKECPECALRLEAIRRRVQGERRCDIYRDLGRSRQWFDKWWARYRSAPGGEVCDHSRAPHTSPHKTSAATEQAVVGIRQTLQAADYGLIGHRTIRAELERHVITPVPSLATIQRLLHQHGLTQPRGAASETAFYPALAAGWPNAVHALDIITRHLTGGAVVQNFHTFDLYSHAVHLSQYADKTSASACLHLLETWADLGLPRLLQMDNEGVFRGGHTHARVIGRLVRLCLFVGVEPLFIPFYEAKRNHWVEGFHALWVQGFWARTHFESLAHVHRQVPRFLRWYREQYRPPSLEGKSPSQMRDGFRPVLLTPELRQLIPDPVPITAGFIHFVRKVDMEGRIIVLNQPWVVGRRWAGQYVWVRIDTARQELSIWIKAGGNAPCRQLKTIRFPISQSVHSRLPSFRRHGLRCPEQWPG